MIETWKWGNFTMTHNATVKWRWRSGVRSQCFEIMGVVGWFIRKPDEMG